VCGPNRVIKGSSLYYSWGPFQPKLSLTFASIYAGTKAFGVIPALGTPFQLQLPLLQQVLRHIANLLDIEIQHQGAGSSCCQHSIARGYDKECKGDFTPLCTWDPPKDLYEQMQCNSVDSDAAE